LEFGIFIIGILRSLIPLSVAIFYFEPQNKRISTTIGAMICVSKRKNREENRFRRKTSSKKKLCASASLRDSKNMSRKPSFVS
jgi:hypothetical protein